MKDFTLSDCVSRINQILNYPSVTYEDISHFFDQAIAELNTTLHTSIPTVSEMLDEVPEPNYTPLVKMTGISDKIPSKRPDTDYGGEYYYDIPEQCFYVKEADGWNAYDQIYGMLPGNASVQLYVSVVVASALGEAYWTPVVKSNEDLVLTNYLPTNWIILFLIPYVCYKYSIREGMDPGVFSEELTQGFQQLQESYDVRETVRLSDVAGKFAYTKQVEENLPDLNKEVPTRAIYDSMKVRRAINATYRDFYDGGWGL